MRKAHAELVNKGFMVRLVDMSEEIQRFINLAPFRQ